MHQIALVGCAHIHTPGFIKRINDRPDIHVKYVWDHDSERAARRAGELNSQVVSDLSLIWNDAEIEHVVICSETNRHEDLVLPAAAAKKHLFVEKPLGIGAADAYKMADAIDAAGVLYHTGYFRRGDAIHLFIREQIQKGSFGKISRIRHTNCHAGSLNGLFDTEWRWMTDAVQAGMGAYGDLGTHSLDILLWLMGSVERVTARLTVVTGRYGDCDESGEGLLEFSNGATGSLAAGWVDVANPVWLEVSGTEGHAYVADGKLYFKSKHVEGADGKSPWTALPPAQVSGFDLFLDKIQGKDSGTLVTAQEAAYRSAVMEALYAGIGSKRGLPHNQDNFIFVYAKGKQAIMADKMRVGMIGLGGISRVHMPGWIDNPYTEIVAGCDIDPKPLKIWKDKYGIDYATLDSQDLFNDPSIDIIDICTPNSFHSPLAVAALKAGKHVLCEKPLAPNPAAIQAMIDARDASGKTLMTAQHFRFTPQAKAMKAAIDQGVLGDIYHARSWMLRRAAAPTTPGFILKDQSSGGAVIDIGVHILDLTLWFMGNPKPISVTGVARSELAHKPGAFSIWGGAIPQVMNVEEFASAFVRFENGATLILEVSWLLHHKTEGEDMQMWLYGTEGGSHWPVNKIYQTDYAAQKHIDTTLATGPELREAHAQECYEFAKAVAEGKPSPVPAEQSLQVLAILDGVYQSQAAGGEIKLA